MAKSVILLSGGLDSLVSLGLASQKYNVKLALTFDYGQKAAQTEIKASSKICEYYNIEHKVIKLDFLKDITKTSLCSEEAVPTGDGLLNPSDSAKNVWVPNRNGVFVNIAAAYADSFKIDYVVIGANKEEAVTFTDNSEQFIVDVNEALESSTNYDVKVIAPLIDMDKNQIVKKAIELNVPLKDINSCYNASEKHCGKCESCSRLKRSLENAGAFDIIEKLFE